MAESYSWKEIIPLARSYSKTQLAIWLDVLENPMSIAKKIEAVSSDSILSALRFVLFIYAIVFLLRLPLYSAYLHVDATRTDTFLMFFVVNIVSFVMCVLCLHVSSKVMFGRASLVQTFQFSSYVVVGYWPLLQLINYIDILEPSIRSKFAGEVPGPETAGLSILQILITLLTITFFGILIKKAVPVVKYVNKVGAFRATIILIAGLTLTLWSWALVLMPVFHEMIASLRSGAK